MRNYYQSGALNALEQRVRRTLVKRVYGGREHEVDNLFARLTNYFAEKYLEPQTRRGIEDLSKELKPDVEILAKSIYKRYRAHVEEALEKDNIGAIYHGRSHIFMKGDVRKSRDWAIRYAALLDILDKGNEFAAKVAEFDINVRKLLGIYHNLYAHEATYLKERTFDSCIKAMEDITQNRQDISGIEKSDDGPIREFAEQFRRHSYRTQAAILFDFASRPRKKDEKMSRSELSSLESNRSILARRLSEIGLLPENGAMADFYRTHNAVYDLLGRSR